MKLNSPIAFLKVLLLASSLLLAACSRKGEVDVNSDQEATISLSLPDAQLRGGVLFTGDQEITKVRILVFKGEGLDVQKLFTANTTEFVNPFSLVAHAGPRKIYVIANESTTLGARLSSIVFERDLKAALLDDLSASATLPLVFTGEAQATLRSDQTVQATVPLQRVVAKVTLSLKHHSAAASDQVQIRKVLINRLAKKEPLLPRTTGFTLGTPWEWTKTETMPLVNNDANYKPYIKEDAPLYIYENLGSVADTAGRAPILMVEALYNGIATNYYAYVNDNSSSADHHYSIKRNHHYKLTGDITKLGEYSFLKLTTQVLPWDVENLSHTILEPIQSKLEPHTVFTGPNYASKEEPFRVTICIKATEGARWKATLTNGLEFALEGDTSGDANANRDYTVIIKPLKPVGNKARKTELYFMVDGKEVVLKKESGQRYTRIEIIQKPRFI